MIDFHCHLDLYPDPFSVRDECAKRGLYLLSVTTTPSAWKKTADLALDSPRVRTALGLHPQLAGEREFELPLFDETLKAPRYVGEVGLDGGREYKPTWEAQLRVFEHILRSCSDAGGRVISIHSRRASGAVLDSLTAFPKAGTPVLHWFSGSLHDLDRAVSIGCWFSIGCAMLVGDKGRSLVKRMPRERVLTESDGPFVKINGTSIMPWSVEDAVSQLSLIWNLSEISTQKLIAENFRRLCTSLPALEAAD